ncbi:hypothetical protein C2G38_2182055 [Gigaspora rosea]|uniref:HNH nuclease domain-containing protein n=1 Tax=Gigaspora rosea TaxID=44941 RepID=A0A397VDH5_9GLOM|nr:hypothetical protein C2G38_2182055 [Gigaspora rosea]
MEIWLSVTITSDLLVSNLRRIKMFLQKKVMYELSLKFNDLKKSFAVHILVAQAFIPNPENKSHVNHIMISKHDNRADNLEWVTPKENAEQPDPNEEIEQKNSVNKVALAFCPKEEEKDYVNHIDASNFEWCTQKENMQHAVRLGLGCQHAVKQSFREFPSIA